MLEDADVSKLLDATTAGGPASTPVAAVDSTGLTTDHASEYFTRRRRETGDEGPRTAYHAFPELAPVCDVATHEVLALRVGVGPSPDVSEFEELVRSAHARRKVGRMPADAGYDSESNHRYAREDLGVATLIPPKRGRPSKDGRPPTGRYRREMSESFDEESHGQRWQVETVMSMVKRRRGWTTWSRSEAGQSRDLRLLALTHNILI